MAQSPGNNQQDDPCSAQRIIRSAGVIACSATGYACPLEDLMQTCEVLERSVDINAPASGPGPGAADDVMHSAGVIAIAASGFPVRPGEVDHSLRLIENAVSANAPNSPDPRSPFEPSLFGAALLEDVAGSGSSTSVVVRACITLPDGIVAPNHILTSGCSTSTEEVSRRRPEIEAPGTSNTSSSHPSHTVGVSTDAIARVSRDNEIAAQASFTEPKFLCRIQRVTRASLRSGHYDTADGNIASIICTTRAARSNSFRARREALKARSDASRARNNTSRAIAAAGGPSDAPPPASGPPARTRRAPPGGSARVTRSASSLSVTASTSGAAPRSSGSSRSMKRSASTTSSTTSITVRTGESTKITVLRTDEACFTDTDESSTNEGASSSSTRPPKPRCSKGQSDKVKRSKGKSSANPLPTGDRAGRVTRSTSGAAGTSSAAGSGGSEMGTTNATVTSISINIPPGGIIEPLQHSATITSGTIVLPVSEGSAIITHTVADNVPVDEESVVIMHVPVDPSIAIPLPAPVPMSTDEADSPAETSDAVMEPAANITYPPRNISCSTEAQPELEGAETARPTSPAAPPPPPADAPPPPAGPASPPPAHSVSATGTSSGGDECAPSVPADADKVFL